MNNRKRKLSKYRFKPCLYILTYFIKTPNTEWERKLHKIWHRGKTFPKVTIRESNNSQIYGFQLEYNRKTNEWAQYFLDNNPVDNLSIIR